MASNGLPTPTIMLPIPPEKYSQGWMNRFVASVVEQLTACVHKTQAETELFMQSGSGKIYKLVVDETVTPPVLRPVYVKG